MPTLRLTSESLSSSRYRVELSIESRNSRLPNAKVDFELFLKESEREKFRWYFEEYLQYPHEPAPAIAAEILEAMMTFGGDLFQRIFNHTQEARLIWTEVESDIAGFRFEIHAARDQSLTIPWELMRNPVTGVRPALDAKAFVRCTPRAASVALPKDGNVRVLLVISRPQGARDVSFRAVAARLTEALDQSFHITALRPPTYERLENVLRAAASAGQPFHIVHFDGHGTFGDLFIPGSSLPAQSKRGYISFESKIGAYVPGDKVGSLLTQNGVPVLVLNACQSARTEAQAAPSDDLTGDTARAFLSFAHEAIEAGLSGIVAMSHAIYVDTAAQFVSGLYLSLAAGHSLGEAVTQARRKLAVSTERHIWFEARSLQDWPVPIVYENQPLVFGATNAAKAETQSTTLLPQRPTAGFLGRDSSLLSLDRSFDSSRLILLHGYAGNGKTSIAAEFARWYERTGGVAAGDVLYSSFEIYTPLRTLLDELADRFCRDLDRDWLRLPNDEARRDTALKLLRSRPILWIWDNIEPINGFPPGTRSAWTSEEQNELRDFLRDAATTQAYLLLASRRDEKLWLNELPHRIVLPELDTIERFQLAAAIARQSRGSLGAASDWMPLLDFSGGNPMALTILIRQALQQKLSSKLDIDQFVQHLRDGEAQFADEENEGRSRSLAASLQYGFEGSFQQAELRQLALLELFQGFVDVEVLARLQGESGPDKQVLTQLLDRAVAIGQLTIVREDLPGYYIIHPALPWFFRRLIKQYHPGRDEELMRAFVHAEATVSEGVREHYERMDKGTIAHLQYEEANLIQAFRWASARGLWDDAALVLPPLQALYEHTGRSIEWIRLVQQIESHIIDPNSFAAKQGVGLKAWSLVIGYSARLARDSGQLQQSLDMQALLEEYAWKQTETLINRGAVVSSAGALATKPTAQRPKNLFRVARNLNSDEGGAVIGIGVQLNAVGQVLRQLGRGECVSKYLQALVIAEAIGDWRMVGSCCDNLIYSYCDLATLQGSEKAEYWAKLSLDLSPKIGMHWWVRAHAGVGRVWKKVYLETVQRDEPDAGYLLKALGSLLEAERWLQAASTAYDRALVHSEVGNLYTYLNKPALALEYFQKAIKYEVGAGRYREVANLQFNVAVLLGNSGLLKQGIEYATAALVGYERLGLGNGFQAQSTRRLLDVLRQGTAFKTV
jgi:tetratricopeptide (TPR) repeat protein